MSIRLGSAGAWSRAALITASASAALLVSGVGVARAAVGHRYLCQITGTAPGSATECHSGGSAVTGGLVNPWGVTSSGGNIWVADAGNAAVDEFSSSGAFVSQQTGGAAGFITPSWVRSVALDDLTQHLYVADSWLDAVDVFDSTGAFVAKWTGSSTPSGSFGRGFVYAAVDNSTSPSSGDVYVTDPSHGVIDKLDASGSPVAFSGSASYISGSQLTGVPDGPFSNAALAGIAVDSSGNIYALDQNNEVVDEFDQTGRFVRQFTGAGTPQGSFGTRVDAITGVGVDDATGNVYIVDSANNAVDEFSSSGSFVAELTGAGTPTGSFSGPLGVAVDPSGDVYVTDPGNQVVDEFGPDVTSGPPAIGGESSTASATSASVTAQISPFALDTTCQVQYVGDASFRSSGYTSAATVPCSPSDLGSGFAYQSATATLTGLALDTTYHYRFVATNQAGAATGSDQTFTTFGVKSVSVQTLDQSGNPFTQAGGHPYELVTDVHFNTTQTLCRGAAPCQNKAGVLDSPAANFRDLYVDLPAGLIGNPTSVPTCTDSELTGGRCSGAAQVGTVDLSGTNGDCHPTFCGDQIFPLYNIVPPAGVPARFGFNAAGSITAHIDASVRTGGDYGVTAGGLRVEPDAGIVGVKVTIWGVPADSSHDAARFCAIPGGGETAPCSSDQPLVPFLTDPTSCSGPLTATARTDAWQDPGDFTTASSTMPAFTGCNQLDFNPTITIQPDTTVADSPSGLHVDLYMPQEGLLNPSDLAEADLKDATVTLPAGVSVNPSAANGLTACTPDQIGIDNANEPSCPDSSKIGTVEVDTPLLSTPLTGGVYVAQQNNNPFNSLLAIYVTAEADGTLVKLAGHVVADPVTGQLETTFSNNPQLPFTDFKLDFFGGPHGALATPEACGAMATSSDFSPWSGGPETSLSDPFAVSSGCVSGFSPSFTAGTVNVQAGSYSPFVLSFGRSDTDQYFQGVSVALAPGLVGKLAGVQECSDAQLAAAAANTGPAELASPSCPAGAQVGTVTTGAGPGPDPFFISGKAYLTGPYKGAPYGLAVVVPAVAGPYDLGTVVVRQALYIDPTTAQVTAVSDPFPQILQGIPLRIRRVDVSMNRPGFTLNPTSCNPMAINGALSSTGGLSADMSSRFQVGGCSGLGFSPKLSISLTGRGRTRSGDHPTLTATLTDPSGQANIHTAKVALPLSLALDVNNSQHVCSYDVAQAVHGGAVGCPASTIVGQATAQTPLLDRPLSGPVYLVQGIRFGRGGQRIHTLPSLLIPLRGQIAIDLRASSAVNGAQQLVTTFATIPDAPVSKFVLSVNGGRKGILVITGRGRSICGNSQVTDASFGAQSGHAMSSAITMSTPCPRVKFRARKGQRHGGRHAPARPPRRR